MDRLHALLDEAAVRQVDDLIETRHHLHRHPELSNREQRTAEYLQARLRAAGADEVRAGLGGGHGVVAVFHGKRPGGRVALRADMDALPIREASGEPFASRQVATGPDGLETPVAHACGHDFHMAAVLHAGIAFSRLRDEIDGSLVCVFQPAEEGAPLGEHAGAQAMLDEGAFDGIEPESVFGMHVAPLPSGTVGLRAGTQFAASSRFSIGVSGIGTHVALPWMGVNPLPAAAMIVTRCGDLVRGIAPWEPATVACSHLTDNGRFNVIGDRVILEGTIRASRDADLRELQARLVALAEGCASAQGCSAGVEFHQPVPAVVNDAGRLAAAMPALRRVVGEERLLPAPPTLGYDDVSSLLNAFGGLYLLYGAQDTRQVDGQLEALAGGRGLYPNHHPAFYANDNALLDSVRLHLHVAVDQLTG